LRRLRPLEAEREFRASFERQARASRGLEVGAGVAGALIQPAWRATFSRGVDLAGVRRITINLLVYFIRLSYCLLFSVHGIRPG
jgi:hypothetical protein